MSSSQSDMVEFEVALLDSFPPVVLAIVDRRFVSHVESTWTELGSFTKRMEVSKDKLKDWPRDDLVVFAESSSVFYDVVTDFLMTQVI